MYCAISMDRSDHAIGQRFASSTSGRLKSSRSLDKATSLSQPVLQEYATQAYRTIADGRVTTCDTKNITNGMAGPCVD